MLMNLIVTLILLAIAYGCGRFVYDVRYPEPGTRPTFMQVLLVGPLSIVAAIAGVFGLMGVFHLFG